jgi:hypothetical protein
MATFPTIASIVSRHETRISLDSVEEADTTRPETGETVALWKDSQGSNDFGSGTIFRTGDPNGQDRIECQDAGVKRARQVNRSPLDTAIGAATDHTTVLAYRLRTPTNDIAQDVYEEETGGIDIVKTAGNALTVGGPKATITAQATADSDWHILVIDVAIANGKMNVYLDGSQVGVETDCTDTMSAPLINYQLAFASPGDVDFVACVIFDEKLSTANRQRMEWYLNLQYGLGISGLTNPDANTSDSGMSMGIGIFPYDG